MSSQPTEKPRKRRPIARWIGLGVLAVVAFLLLVAGGGYLWLRQSLPQVEGVIEVAGLEAPVTVVRDRWAIPHIEAQSLLDATFAQGFVHAQDRLWQMEFQRRLGAGRLAESLGEAALPIDRFMRTLGFYRLAKASLAHMAPETIAWLEAYAAGVNAFLETRSGPLPPEFLILRHGELEPWTPADSVVWVKMMAMNLSANWRDELLRAQLAERLSRAQIADFWPDYPDAAPITLVELARDLPARELAAVLPPGPAVRPGSNAWVIDGERSRSGGPLLANDPHLGMKAPGTWYLAHLKAPELELIGTTLPGVPGIVLGHNGHIAWGFTTTGSDTQDLFVERLDPDDPGRYLTPDGSAAFDVREEVIEVKGGEPVSLMVRATRHGPVLSDLLPDAAAVAAGDDQVLALAWPALEEDDLSIQALFRFTRARDRRSFVAALRDVGAPQQNVLFADTAGHIGLYVPGRVPIRKSGHGLWPVPGWTGEYDWSGWIPFEDLPHVLDPADGALFNANNRVVGDDYPYLITVHWEASHRARRIAELLPDAHDLDGFAAMQADQLSMLARDLLPRLLEVEPTGERAAEAMARLAAWDRVMRPDAPEPLIFSAWYRGLERLIYADELGPLFEGSWRIRPEFIQHVLSERPDWCDDVDTAPAETCPEIIARALDLALGDLEARFGAADDWRWGEAHFAWMAHPVFRTQPLLGRLFNIVVPTGGGPTSIDVGHYAVDARERPFASTHAASYRGLFDLADLERSRFIAATGQSGHPLSAHYRDLTRLWQRGATVPVVRQAAEYGAGAVGELVLQPSPAARSEPEG